MSNRLSIPATSSAKRQITQENIPMKLTWYGHSAFRVESGRRQDPDRSVPVGQPVMGQGLGGAGRRRHACAAHPRPQRPRRRCARHPEEDRRHAGRQFRDLHVPGRAGRRLAARSIPGNLGGTVDCGGFTTTFVQALHSSSFGGEGRAAIPISAIRPAWSCISPTTRRSITWATPTSSPTWR